MYAIIMLWQLQRIKPYILDYLVDSKFLITYDFFHWVQIMSRPAMEVLFGIMSVAAVLVGLGVVYRLSAGFLFVSWSYLFLLCKGHYNNHYYLFCLIPLLLLFVHADQWGSLKQWRKKKTMFIPYWQVFILKVQLVIVYFYGGLAKMEPDWLAGYPMKIWLSWHEQIPIVGSFLKTEAAAYFFSYGGIIFDLSIGFLLWHKKTRLWVLFPLAFFHISNHFLWNIGAFPWFMLGATVLFFEPDLPQRFIEKLKATFLKKQAPKKAAKTKKVTTNISKPTPSFSLIPLPNSPWRKVVIGCLGVYLAFQLLFPFRRFVLYTGNSSWHGQANYFSWRMLASDRADAVRIKVSVPGQGVIGHIKLDEYINRRQFYKLCQNPKSFCHFAHFIKDEMTQNASLENPEINVVLWREFNARPYQLVIDTTVNLAAIACEPIREAPWLLPVNMDLPYKDNVFELNEQEVEWMYGE